MPSKPHKHAFSLWETSRYEDVEVQSRARAWVLQPGRNSINGSEIRETALLLRDEEKTADHRAGVAIDLSRTLNCRCECASTSIDFVRHTYTRYYIIYFTIIYIWEISEFDTSIRADVPSSGLSYFDVGAAHKQFTLSSASNLQFVTSTTFLLLTYAKYLNLNGGAVSCGTSKLTEQKLIKLAKSQVDYILGDNPKKMSYMVGFGERYPKNIHHRGSSLPSIHEHPQKISCNYGYHYNSLGSPNPNVLVGAIVGGPDKHDNFSDDRNNYQQSEPATYINAPFVGALAFFSAQPTS
ncbi:endoglucanase 1-like [Cicer arietinum]|uniref:endoglucanase 1-like n=1 Tax=Cicer arietinum TaxID=3827 RepID=UPI003CC59C9F